LDGGNVVLAHSISGGDVVHIENGLEDFDCVLIKSLDEILFVDTLVSVVLTPLDQVLNWNGDSTVFNFRPDSFNNIIDGSFVFINSNIEEISLDEFVMKSFNSIEFFNDIAAHAFFGDVVNDFILIESSDSINVNGFLDGEHVLPLFHISGSIIIAVEWLSLSWGHQVLNVLVNWVMWKSTVFVVVSSMSRGCCNGGGDGRELHI
jgi:hypothetical protein